MPASMTRGFTDLEAELVAHHLIYGKIRESDAFNWLKKVGGGLPSRFPNFSGSTRAASKGSWRTSGDFSTIPEVHLYAAHPVQGEEARGRTRAGRMNRRPANPAATGAVRAARLFRDPASVPGPPRSGKEGCVLLAEQEFPLPDEPHAGVHDRPVEKNAFSPGDFLQGRFDSQGGTVGPVGGHGLHHV